MSVSVIAGECPSDETLAAFLDEDDADARHTIRAHLTACGRCRAFIVELLRIRCPEDEPARPSGHPAPGRYVVDAVIGAGGMGVVYSATDPALGRKLAVKVLRDARDAPVTGLEPTVSGGGDTRRRARLVREGRILASVVHPNVVTVYDVGESNGRVFVAMEFIDGGTLRSWLGDAAHSFAEILDMFLAIGEGLQAVHQAGIVHRDFKPENVLVGTDGRPRVTDFGLARRATAPEAMDGGESAASSAAPGLTQAGTVLGTPAYMAPEQMRGDTAGAAADVFAFATALWEAVYGARPFYGVSLPELESSIERRAFVRSRSVAKKTPRRLRFVLARALAPDARQRPPLATLLTELAALRPTSQWRRVVLGVGGAMLLGLSSAAGVLAYRDRDRRQCDEHPFAGSVPEEVRSRLDAPGRTVVDRLLRRFDEVRGASCRRSFVARTAPRSRFAADLACLADTRHALDEVLAGTAAPQPGDQPAAVALEQLPDPRLCAARHVAPAGDVRLAAAATAARLGRHAAAAQLYGAIAKDASLSSSPTRLAQALVGVGRAALQTGDRPAAARALYEGEQAALYAGDFATGAEADLALLGSARELGIAAADGERLLARLWWKLEIGELGPALRVPVLVTMGRWRAASGDRLAAEIALRAAVAAATLDEERERATAELARVVGARESAR